MSSHGEPGTAAEPDEDEVNSQNDEYDPLESSESLDGSVPAADHGDDSGEPSHPATVIIYSQDFTRAMPLCTVVFLSNVVGGGRFP